MAAQRQGKLTRGALGLNRSVTGVSADVSDGQRLPVYADELTIQSPRPDFAFGHTSGLMHRSIPHGTAE